MKNIENCQIFGYKNHFVPLLGGGLALYMAVYLNRNIRDFIKRRSLDSKRKKKQDERAKQFESLEKEFVLTTEYQEIVDLPFETLVEKLKTKTLTARKVLSAFVAKTLVITKESNCVTEFCPQMMEWADELDKLSDEDRGPLHGVPICIKDDHDIKGMDSTLGFSNNLYKPAKETAVVIQILQKAGAIPFCKTNVPQSLFSTSSHNPIFGTTSNPRNKELSPGGSSSGTGCLVGAGGAAFGTGSDIAGSLRIPAHFNGITALRPTIGRISDKGITMTLELNAGYTVVSGIIAPKAKALAAIFNVLMTDSVQNRYDPLTVPLPWNDKMYASKDSLKIGYFTSFPFFPALGDTPETVLKAKGFLESAGHELIPFEIPNVTEILGVMAALITADGGNQINNKLKNDKISPVVEKFTYGRTWLSYLLIKLIFMFRKPVKAELAAIPVAQKSEILWEYLAKQRDLKYEMLQRMKDLDIDLILSPVFPFPASRIKDTDILIGACAYTVIWNLLDFPSGVVPLGSETCTNIASYNDEGNYYLKLAKEGIKSASGMPIGVQIIGKPFKEEMILRVLEQLEEINSKK